MYFVLCDLTMLEPQQNDLRTILFRFIIRFFLNQLSTITLNNPLKLNSFPLRSCHPGPTPIAIDLLPTGCHRRNEPRLCRCALLSARGKWKFKLHNWINYNHPSDPGLGQANHVQTQPPGRRAETAQQRGVAEDSTDIEHRGRFNRLAIGLWWMQSTTRANAARAVHFCRHIHRHSTGPLPLQVDGLGLSLVSGRGGVWSCSTNPIEKDVDSWMKLDPNRASSCQGTLQEPVQRIFS